MIGKHTDASNCVSAVVSHRGRGGGGKRSTFKRRGDDEDNEEVCVVDEEGVCSTRSLSSIN